MTPIALACSPAPADVAALASSHQLIDREIPCELALSPAVIEHGKRAGVWKSSYGGAGNSLFGIESYELTALGAECTGHPEGGTFDWTTRQIGALSEGTRTSLEIRCSRAAATVTAGRAEKFHADWRVPLRAHFPAATSVQCPVEWPDGSLVDAARACALSATVRMEAFEPMLGNVTWQGCDSI